MQGILRLQEWIHRFEEGVGARYVRWSVAVFGFLLVAVLYDSFCFRNFSNPEAMETAQLARNIAKGEGYVTDYVRPISMYLTSTRTANQSPLLKEGHRDISNAPLYPLLLAPLLRFTPGPGDLASLRVFNIYGPDLYIALLNQLLLGIGTMLVFRLALDWFNRRVAWLSAILFVLTELYWRFSISGLSTILLIDLVLGLALLLTAFDRGNREGAGTARLLLLAAGIGIVTALGMLTRYSTGWLLVPVLIFVITCSTQRRLLFFGIVLVTFVAVGMPWILRTVHASGLPFGTATYAPLQDTFVFSGDTLERSLKPGFDEIPGGRYIMTRAAVNKAVGGLREIVLTELPRVGGNWMWGLFLATIIIGFQNPAAGRMRWFVIGSLMLMVPVQAVARTHLSWEVPQVNSENLLVIFSPFVLILGVGVFMTLLESWRPPTLGWHYGIVVLFAGLMSLPLLLGFLPPRTLSFAPPYYPPRIQQVGRYVSERELLMSDIPWAVAWYGERQCVALTMGWRKEYEDVSDFEKTVNGLYVSTRTTDSKFFSTWFSHQNRGWGEFFVHALLRQEIPGRFPLKYSPEGLFMHGELLLMDRDRWSEPEEETKSSLKKD
jgi:4-amino-4-deoxy-L-arabinose transferase-like glycosyltransferase